MNRRNFLKDSAATWAASALAGRASAAAWKIQGVPPAANGTAANHPYPEGDKGDLWLVAGQSNMGGHGTVKREFPDDPRILFFSANGDEWITAKDRLEPYFFPHGPHGARPDYTRLPVGGIGPALFFARHVIASTKRPIGIIGVATGGAMTTSWDPTLIDKNPQSNPPYMYGPMIERVRQANGYGKLKGLVWYQGESDASGYPDATNTYEHNLLTFIDRIREDTGNPNLPIILGQICRLDTFRPPAEKMSSEVSDGALQQSFDAFVAAWEHVRDVQRRVPSMRPNVYTVSTVDLYPLADPIHLDFEAHQRLGPRFGEVALSKIYHLPGHATPVQPESVEVRPLLSTYSGEVIKNNAVIRVRFSGVSGKLNAAGRPSGFSVRFSGRPPAGMQNEASVYAIEFDPKDPAALLLIVSGDPAVFKQKGAALYYGAGLNPYCNILDDKDLGLPAFGPVPLGAPGEIVHL